MKFLLLHDLLAFASNVVFCCQCQRNNNKLRDKALKFYLIFVYLFLRARWKRKSWDQNDWGRGRKSRHEFGFAERVAAWLMVVGSGSHFALNGDITFGRPSWNFKGSCKENPSNTSCRVKLFALIKNGRTNGNGSKLNDYFEFYEFGAIFYCQHQTWEASTFALFTTSKLLFCSRLFCS